MMSRKAELIANIASRLYDLDGMTPSFAAETALRIVEAAEEKAAESERVQRDLEPLIAAAVRCVEQDGEGAFVTLLGECDFACERLDALRAALVSLGEIPGEE